MNWGLFLALTSFLLPLSFALRLIANGFWARGVASTALQRLRLAQLLLVSVAICGKTPVMLFALTGREADLGHVTEAFMVSGWGFAQLLLLIGAIIAAEWSSPLVLARLEDEATAIAAPGAYYARHIGVLVICLLLAWVGAR